MSITLTGSARVAAVVAHPDDDLLVFYGTLRGWSDAGASVTVIVATHGANGVSVADQAAGITLTTVQRLAELRACYQDTGITVSSSSSRAAPATTAPATTAPPCPRCAPPSGSAVTTSSSPPATTSSCAWTRDRTWQTSSTPAEAPTPQARSPSPSNPPTARCATA
ncbi:PIG-L family deacetylase [Kitasatospora sp. NPDC059146]|uniref:PIG-L family deacetylase n=1 Tax=unclassified Kitasatospora TaxID=2633591 RepID=UPI0036947AC7